MPLGQAPFGTREPGDGPRAPKSPFRLSDPRGWLLWVAVAALLALVLARRGDKGSKFSLAGNLAGPSECITHRSCAEGWRCFAVPKDDPFVVTGVCAQVCESALQCPGHYRCEQVAANK